MALDGLGEVGGGRGRCPSAVDDNRCASMRVAVLAHLKNVYSIVYEHHIIAVGIDPALSTSALP
jgi:hypothetical protein